MDEKEVLRKKINEGKATDEEIIRYKDVLGGSLGPAGMAAYNAAKSKTKLTEANTFKTGNDLNIEDYNKKALQQEIANKSPEDLADEQDNNGNPIDPNSIKPEETTPDNPEESSSNSMPSIEELREQYANDNEGYKKALQEYGHKIGDNGPYKPMSIQDAYYKGLLDKGSRDYMMADTLANFGRNLGRDIGNVGAQFSGGTIDNNYNEGLWSKRNKSMVETGVGAEQNKIEGSNENLNYQQAIETINNSKLTNEQKNKQLAAARVIQNAMDTAKTATEKNVLAGILTNVANGSVDEASLIALGATGLKADAKTVINIMNGKQTQTTNDKFGGSTGNALEDFNRADVDKNMKNRVTDFAKLDEKAKNKEIMKLYKGAGDAKDDFVLAALLDSGQIPENYNSGGLGPITYQKIVDRVNKLKKDPKWLDNYTKYTSDYF